MTTTSRELPRDTRAAAHPERDLVERAQRYEPEALADAFERNFDRIYSFVYSAAGDEASAEDLTTQVFIRALDALPEYREPALGVTVFLYDLAQKLVAQHLRQRARRAGRQPDANGAHPDIDEAVRQSMGELPDGALRVLMFRFHGGMDSQEIADVTGLNHRRVEALQHAGLKAMRTALMKRQVLQ